MTLSRREFLYAAAAPAILRASARRPTDITIDEVTFAYEEHRYRTPYKFGGRTVDRVTLLNVVCQVRSADGRVSRGFGSMPLGNAWGWPSRVLTFDQTLDAMKALAGDIGRLTKGYREPGHPIDINVALEPEYLRAARALVTARHLPEAMPPLAVLVVASPFDAAVHDAYGKLLGRSCYRTYGRDLMRHDLSRYLGPAFRGRWLDRYVAAAPEPRTPLFHSVGGLDPLDAAALKAPLRDGLPETLTDWIPHNGLRRIKIKLQGDDMGWDLERTIAIDRIAAEVPRGRGVRDWAYCLDFNERCPGVEALLEFLAKVKERTPAGFRRIQYVEQPTGRDLRADRRNVMHRASRLRPIVVDEALTDLDSLVLARDMGYSGVALKACKGQTQALLMGAAAQRFGMFLCVQDLTCPGASLIHSAGLSAHVPGVAGIEANARQYVPAANRGWDAAFPGLFDVKDGYMRTDTLTGAGLGIPEPVIARHAQM